MYVSCQFANCSYVFVLFFFFFKQKTAYEMRISDWSSDVCSSDLIQAGERTFQSLHVGEAVLVRNEDFVHDDLAGDRRAQADLAVDRRRTQTLDRKSVV